MIMSYDLNPVKGTNKYKLVFHCSMKDEPSFNQLEKDVYNFFETDSILKYYKLIEPFKIKQYKNGNIKFIGYVRRGKKK